MTLFSDVQSKNLARQTRAAASIRREGQPATLRRVQNVGESWNPVQVVTDVTIVVVDLNERIRDASGTLIAQTRRKLLMSASAGVTPVKGDKVALGRTKEETVTAEASFEVVNFHEIQEVRPLAPGGTVIMWELELVS